MNTQESSSRVRVVDGVALTEFHATGGLPRTPLVFVHGGLHGSWQWKSTQRWFADAGRPSTALDWFSHGQSRQLEPTEWLRRGILEVQEEIGIAVAEAATAPVLVGHSMGGLASLAYAAAHPPSIAGLVLLAPVAPAQFAGAPIELPVNSSSPWGPPPLEVAAHLFFEGASNSEHEAIYARLQAESPAAVWEATRWTASVDVNAITVPVLIMTGDRDELAPVEIVAALAGGIGAEFVILPGVSHGLSFDPSWTDQRARIEAWVSKTLHEAPSQ